MAKSISRGRTSRSSKSSRNSKSGSSNMLGYAIFIIIIIIILIFNSFFGGSKTNQIKQSKEGFDFNSIADLKNIDMNKFKDQLSKFNTNEDKKINKGNNKNKKLVLIYAEWCGHCKKMKPEWDKFEKTYPDNCVSYESETQEAKNLFKKHNLSGYPSILVMENDNLVTTYNDDRTFNAYKKYLNL